MGFDIDTKTYAYILGNDEDDVPGFLQEVYDLAIAGQTNPDSFAPVTKIYRNDGNDVFVDLGASMTGVANGALAWGDYDQDTWPDLLVVGLYNELALPIATLYHNESDGSGGRPLRGGRARWYRCATGRRSPWRPGRRGCRAPGPGCPR